MKGSEHMLKKINKKLVLGAGSAFVAAVVVGGYSFSQGGLSLPTDSNKQVVTNEPTMQPEPVEVDPSKATTTHSQTPTPTLAPTPTAAATTATPIPTATPTPAPAKTVVEVKNIFCRDPYNYRNVFKTVLTNYSDGTSSAVDLNGTDVMGKCVIVAGTW